MKVYAKFRNYPLHINKVLGIFEKGNKNNNNCRSAFGPFWVQKKTKLVPYWTRVFGTKLTSVSGQSSRREHSHYPGGRLPLLSAWPEVTFPAVEMHCSPLISMYQDVLLADRNKFAQNR